MPLSTEDGIHRRRTREVEDVEKIDSPVFVNGRNEADGATRVLVQVDGIGTVHDVRAEQVGPKVTVEFRTTLSEDLPWGFTRMPAAVQAGYMVNIRHAARVLNAIIAQCDGVSGSSDS